MSNIISQERILQFGDKLKEEEKSIATQEKYLRDVRAFAAYLGEAELTKQAVMAYKKEIAFRYAPASVNSMLVSVNSFLDFVNRRDCRVRLLRIQRQIFASEGKELTVAEYRRLVRAAEGTAMALVLRTICETGIRVSELAFITAEAVMTGKAVMDCKSKRRVILLPPPLKKRLVCHIKKAGITSGPIFVTRSGAPLNRSNIWRSMKALCRKAAVAPEKVFPHNLRHLFARTFYAMERDIVRLADLLGHSSINTTRIYTVETGETHLYCLERIHRALAT